MKKSWMILAIAALATATHAAVFTWGGSVDNNANVANDGWAGVGTVYTLTYLGTSAPGGLPYLYNTSTGLTNLGGTIVAIHTLSQAEWDNGDWAETYTAPADAINGFYLVTLWDPETPAYFGAITAEVAGLMETSGAGSIIPAMQSLGSSVHGSLIPEPTTTALVALGVAALGLRRKRER